MTHMDGSSEGDASSDERIREAICDRIMEHGIDATDVDVLVKDDEVSLAGTVPQSELKRAIEEICAGASGVKNVHNQLSITPIASP